MSQLRHVPTVKDGSVAERWRASPHMKFAATVPTSRSTQTERKNSNPRACSYKSFTVVWERESRGVRAMTHPPLDLRRGDAQGGYLGDCVKVRGAAAALRPDEGSYPSSTKGRGEAGGLGAVADTAGR